MSEGRTSIKTHSTAARSIANTILLNPTTGDGIRSIGAFLSAFESYYQHASPPSVIAQAIHQGRIIREEEPVRPSERISTLDAEALSTVSSQRGDDPRHLTQTMRGELDWIAMKALEKDRTRRYESASSFAADVQHYLNDEPVAACPPSFAYRFGKFARRNKAALVIGGLVAVALLVGIVGLAIGNALIAQQRNAAQAAQQSEKAQRLEAERQRQRAERESDEAERQRAAAQQQRDQANQLREEAERQKKVAEEKFQRAREAVDTYLTKVSEDTLLNAPSLQPLRKELLQLALKYYQEFIKQHADDPSVQAELAQAYYRVGTITGQIDSRESRHHSGLPRAVFRKSRTWR